MTTDTTASDTTASHPPNGTEAAETILSRGTVVMRIDQCKGCELCIPACRPGVLKMSDDMNEMGYRYPELFPGCTGCQACFQVCPDFVFDVYKYATPLTHSTTDQPVDTSTPGQGAEPAPVPEEGAPPRGSS